MKKFLSVFMTLLLLLLAGCSPGSNSAQSNEKKVLSDYNLEEFTEKYNFYINGREGMLLEADAWKEGTRKGFQSFSQTMKNGYTIHVMFKENRLQGVLVIMPYEKNYEDSDRITVTTKLITIADKGLIDDKNKEAWENILSKTQMSTLRIDLINNTLYKTEYNGYVYQRSINGAVKWDYYTIMSADYYNDYITSKE